jgi:ABC-type sulfate/molybdate transport systems ATPase subunit
LIAEQNIGFLEVATRVFVLEGGRIRFSGTVAEMTDNEALRRAYFGLKSEATARHRSRGQNRKSSLRANVFRCSPNYGHRQDTSACPLRAPTPDISENPI